MISINRNSTKGQMLAGALSTAGDRWIRVPVDGASSLVHRAIDTMVSDGLARHFRRVRGMDVYRLTGLGRVFADAMTD